MRHLVTFILMLFFSLVSLRAEPFRFSADSTKVLFSSGREFTELVGNAQVISGDIHLKADSIRLRGEEFRFVECVGNVIFRDEEKELFLNAQQISYDRKTKRATAQGQVILEDVKESLVARSVALEIGEDSTIIVFKAGVRIFRDDLMIRAELVQFQREDKLLQLRGFPIVYWGEDEYRAMFIELNIDTEEVTLVGEVSGTIIPKEQEVSEDVPVTPEEQEVSEDVPVTPEEQEVSEDVPITLEEQEVSEGVPITLEEQEVSEDVPVTPEEQNPSGEQTRSDEETPQP